MLLAVYVAYSVLLSLALGRAGQPSRLQPPPAVRREPIRRIVIVGASGRTGRQLVEQALERGYRVTAMVRGFSDSDRRHARLEYAVGDVLDARFVRTTLDGQDAVLCALGHGRFLGPSRILSDGTGHILDAMHRARVPRLVCETSLGIGDSMFRMGLYYTFLVIPLILPFYYWDKTRQERLIAESSVDWVIVRPAVLTNGPRTGGFRHGRRIGDFILTRRVSRADVASFMLDQLESDEFLGTAPACMQASRMA
ncbi:MAG: SDR family oxidoreductase [Rhodothermales bacterium]|nr:SDR family oxidoreductase [Rhodothermales bacterium]